MIEKREKKIILKQWQGKKCFPWVRKHLGKPLQDFFKSFSYM